MEKIDTTWRIFSVYILVILLMLFTGNAFGQIKVVQFNAGWNKANDVKWLNKLSDCDITKVDIVKKPKQQKKHKIVVVPTIIIFKDGEEVQEEIDNQLMSDF